MWENSDDEELFLESIKNVEAKMATDAESVSLEFDLSESYRQEILVITKQIDTLTRSIAGKKTGSIIFSYEHFSEGRVKVVAQKIVSGQLLKTSKHLGLSKKQAELEVVKEMLQLIQAKYCPDESLGKYDHALVQFCTESNLSDPEFTPRFMDGKYYVSLDVGSKVSSSGPANFIKDARANAAKNWLQLYGGNWRQVLNHKNLGEQQSGCLVFKCSGEEESREDKGVNCDKRKGPLGLNVQANSDEVRVIQRSPGLDSTEFTKKTSECPYPAPQNVPSDTSFPTKVNDANISQECGETFRYSTPKKMKSCCDDVKISFKRPRKGSLVLENVDFDEQTDVQETCFRFSSKAVKLNKIFLQSKPVKSTAFVAPPNSNSVKRKNGQKEKASNIFDISDDPYVMEFLKRDKAKAKNVTRNAKKGSVFIKGARFQNESQSSAEQQRNFDVPKKLPQEIEPLQDSLDSIPMSPSLMISPVLPRKLVSLEEDEIGDVENESNEYLPDLDELLKRPERPADGSKTKDEILDEFDRKIAERQRLHEEEMKIVEADIEAENQKRMQRKRRMKENAKLRNRLETELTEPRLRSMFKDNLQYLKDICCGKVESSRHQAYQESIRTRHALYYTIITDPFTDDQLDWTLDEIKKVWMSNRRDELDNKEYVWKVLLAECFIKFYMNFFNFSKNEAMTRISETPLHKKDRLKEFKSISDEEESEED